MAKKKARSTGRGGLAVKIRAGERADRTPDARPAVVDQTKLKTPARSVPVTLETRPVADAMKVRRVARKVPERFRVTRRRSTVVDVLVVERAAADLANKRYLRALRQEVAASSQTNVARRLRVSPSAVNQRLATADRIAPDVPGGFSGASPYEIAQQYAVGRISGLQLLKQLTRWPYAPEPDSWSGAWDEQSSLPPGTWQEVVTALHDGLIDDELYDRIGNARVHQ